MKRLYAIALCFISSYTYASTTPDILIGELFSNLNNRIISEQSLIKEDKNHLKTISDEVIGEHVSFKTMSKKIFGKHWKKLSLEQQEQFVEVFKEKITNVIVSKYAVGTEYSIKVIRTKYNKKSTLVHVTTHLTNTTNNTKTTIAYRLFKSKVSNDWKVYDILAEGISLLQSYRTAISETYTQHGFEKVIENLQP